MASKLTKIETYFFFQVAGKLHIFLTKELICISHYKKQ